MTMKKIGIEIDYSNICKDYNTVYLDRDNKDPATTKCMREVMRWMDGFLSELLKVFHYNIYYLSSSTPVKVDDVASKRFLFYSLEKEITLQSYVIQEAYVEYEGLAAWEQKSQHSILIQNDEDGGGITLFFNENSQEEKWVIDSLKDFSIDHIPFSVK